MNRSFLFLCAALCALTACNNNESNPGLADSSADVVVDTKTDDAVVDEVADRSDESTDASGTSDTSLDVVEDMPDGVLDLRGYAFTNRDGDCASHAFIGAASVIDIQRDMMFGTMAQVVANSDTCTLSSNAIPNYDFNEQGVRFVTPVSELESTWTIPRMPTFQPDVTELELRSYDGLMLNGVVLDLLAAGCFGVGDGRIGCGDTSTPYRYDPMNPSAGFNTDSHNAHTQPDGRYHYHGDPSALYGALADGVSGVIGFAADGFPIYGPYVMLDGQVRMARSGYVLKSGMRDGGPGGAFDGTFVDDYVFDDGNTGDLDECNGMTIDGQYGYYVTNSYPWVLKCFKGLPDVSFGKRR